MAVCLFLSEGFSLLCMACFVFASTFCGGFRIVVCFGRVLCSAGLVQGRLQCGFLWVLLRVGCEGCSGRLGWRGPLTVGSMFIIFTVAVAFL